ncbi:MAG: transglycosylase domain-containing protein [Actinomycetes bacterium]
MSPPANGAGGPGGRAGRPAPRPQFRRPTLSAGRTVLPRYRPAGGRPRRTARQRRHRRHLVVLWVLVAVIAGVGSFTAGLLSAPVDFTTPAPPKSALLLDASGKVFATVRSPYQREEVPANQIPQVMRDAIVSAEDRTFFKNSGVDPLAIARAAWKDVTGSHIQGGSTITQQYVKQVYTNQHRTVFRKVKEAALAVRLERRLTKAEILTRYLNTTYFGNGTYGVQAAAKYYFGIAIKDLDLDARSGHRSSSLALGRAAMLAGLVPAPSVWNPVSHPDLARAHQLDVLNRMVADGRITAQQASDAYGRKPPTIVKARTPEPPTIAPEFRDYVRQRLDATFTPDQLYQGGLRVTTTLDLDLQQAIVKAVREILPNSSDPEAAVVAVDPRTGDMKALTTRVNRKGSHAYQTGGFDLALSATRSTGSTIKPFTLSVALERGHSLQEGICAPSVAFVPNPGGTPNPYKIPNAEHGGGCYTLESALWQSVNTVYGPLALKVGLKRVLTRAVDAGFAPKNRVLKPLVPAKSIGGGLEVTPLSEAVAYSTLVNHGLHHDPRSITIVRSGGSGALDSGEVVYRAPRPHGQQVIKRKIADQVTDAMQGVVDRGTATNAKQDFPVYGKTGTTNEYTDAWFVGCTRTLCIATWMGYDKLKSMRDVEGVGRVFGGTLPAEIFAKAMSNYRSIKAAEKNPQVRVSPTPTHRVKRTVRPQPSHTPKPRPSAVPSKSSKPSPSPRPTDKPTPKPSCSGLGCIGSPP